MIEKEKFNLIPRDLDDIGEDGRYSLDWEEYQLGYRIERATYEQHNTPRVILGYAKAKKRRA